MKYTIVKPVAHYKVGQVVEFEEGKLPLALQAHAISTPADSVDVDDKDLKKLKSDLAAAKKEIKPLKDELASKEELKLEVATPESTK